ncbi:MAG: hypothetical protein Q8M65_09105, partial [Rhodoglobus sp.]|nr:hypothetical protein [Rhodoglobus sp.]
AQPTAPVHATFTEISTTPSYGAAQNYRPFANDWYEQASPARPRRGAGTTAIWLLAFSPILSVALQFVTGWVGPSGPALVLLAAQLVQLAVFVGLILWDRAALRGLEVTPSSAWWLLLPSPIVYLIVRRVTLKRQGVISHAPSNIYVLVLMVALALAALAWALLWR